MLPDAVFATIMFGIQVMRLVEVSRAKRLPVAAVPQRPGTWVVKVD